MKIKNKLLSGFLIVIFLSIAAGYISISICQNILQKSIADSYLLLSKEIMHEIDRNIYDRLIEIQFHLKDAKVMNAVIESNAKFDKIVNVEKLIHKRDKEWIATEEKEITPFIRELLNRKLSKWLIDKMEYYKNKFGYNIFTEIFVTNKYGVVIGLTGKLTDYLQADEEWYKKARKQKQFRIGEIGYDESSYAYTCDIVINLYDENKNYAGIVKASLNLEEIINVLKYFKTEEPIEWKLLTKDGRIIYSTEPYEMFQKDIMGEQVYSKEEDCFIAKQGKKIEEKNFLFFISHSKGFKDYKGFGWHLILKYNTKDIFKPIDKMRNRLIFILIIISIIAIIILLSIFYSIFTPINKLKESIGKITEGRLDTKIEIKSKDELTDLAIAFNKMTTELKIQSKKLTKAQEALVRSEKMTLIGSLASSIAHEIRNPLGVMKNIVYFFNMLKLGKDNPDIKTNLDILDKEIDRADKIISDLLGFSRMQTLVFKLVNINLVITNVLKRIPLNSNTKLIKELDVSLPEVMIDSSQIEQVFYNIIMNSIQAMQESGTLKIKTCLKENFVQISFADTGKGISKKNITRVFEPLFSSKATGTGLGLAVCKWFIDRHEGSLDVESQEGKGATFLVKLPVKNNK